MVDHKSRILRKLGIVSRPMLCGGYAVVTRRLRGGYAVVMQVGPEDGL